MYLAVLLNLATREVVGWAMRHTLEGALTLDALQMACSPGAPRPVCSCITTAARSTPRRSTSGNSRSTGPSPA